tara:strand:+ start:695 stop:1042 length:348 start_codon:yes stop_codon:yes gene_type:complete
MPLDQAAEEAQSRTPMCELFALSARFPATVTLSLQEFALHGGFSACHADGWGIAYFDETGYDTYLVRDTAPAFKSPWVSFVESAPASPAPRSSLIFAKPPWVPSACPTPIPFSAR